MMDSLTFSFLFVTGILVASALGNTTTTSAPVTTGAPQPGNFSDVEIQRILVEYRTKEANKQLVKAFYQGAFGDKDPSAIDKYIDSKTYIQHNPTVEDGAEALKKAHATWFQPGTPKTKVDFRNVGADDDLVFLHIKNTNGDTLQSLVDIFRVKDGKIVEHWDTMQDVPKDLKAQNDHPFF